MSQCHSCRLFYNIAKTNVFDLFRFLITFNHGTVIWSTHFLGNLFAPGLMDKFLMTILICNQGCVTDSFKPSAANNWRICRRVLIATLLNKVLVACPYCIVDRHFLESDFACLDEFVVLALFLLH